MKITLLRLSSRSDVKTESKQIVFLGFCITHIYVAIYIYIYIYGVDRESGQSPCSQLALQKKKTEERKGGNGRHTSMQII